MEESENRHNAVLWSIRLDGQGGVAADNETAGADSIHWLHLQCDIDGVRDVLVNEGLSDQVIDTMIATETRPRALSYDNGILLILRGVNTNPGADPEDMVSVRIWATDSLVITARKSARRLLAMQDIREHLESGSGPKSIGMFVEAAAERLADRIGNVVDEFDDELVNIEHQMEDPSARGIRVALIELRRKAAELRRYLAPQREALDSLYRMRVPFLDQFDFSIREQADRTTRYVEDLDLVRERAVLLQDELRNRVAEQQNQRMYVLALVTAVFLPLSFLTGVFGMNVGGLPGVESTSGFLYVASFMGVVALVVGIWMKFRKWM